MVMECVRYLQLGRRGCLLPLGCGLGVVTTVIVLGISEVLLSLLFFGLRRLYHAFYIYIYFQLQLKHLFEIRT